MFKEGHQDGREERKEETNKGDGRTKRWEERRGELSARKGGTDKAISSRNNALPVNLRQR